MNFGYVTVNGVNSNNILSFPRLFLDYEIYYSGDLCAEFKSRLNDFEISFEKFMTEVMP